MIIVEGMDNTGKTTLINHLAEILYLVQIKNHIKHPIKEPYLTNYLISLYEMDHRVNGGLIVDRWPPISDNIYGPVVRGTPPNPSLYHHYRMASGIVVWCRPPDEVILNFGDRAQMPGVIERSRELIGSYEREMEFVKQHLPVWEYDYTRESPEALTNYLKEFLCK